MQDYVDGRLYKVKNTNLLAMPFLSKIADQQCTTSWWRQWKIQHEHICRRFVNCHAKILSPKLEPHTPVLGPSAEMFRPNKSKRGHMTRERMDCRTSDAGVAILDKKVIKSDACSILLPFGWTQSKPRNGWERRTGWSDYVRAGDLFWAGGKGHPTFIILSQTLVITIQITSFYRSLQSIIVSLAINGPHTISDF